jgi:hypothetical protein
MKRTKLKLNRESIRLLEPHLEGALGGRPNGPTDTTSIHVTCYTCVTCGFSCGGTCNYTVCVGC